MAQLIGLLIISAIIGVVIWVIVQASRIGGLQFRIEQLERQVARLKRSPESSAPAEPASADDTEASSQEDEVAPAASAEAPRPISEDPAPVHLPPRREPRIEEEPPPAAPAGVGWEERLGAQWTVWVGALAIVLGGVFLVRYFAEKGLLGPEVRTAGAGLLGLALIAAGEVARKHRPQIAQGLVASGVGVSFAALVAATSLYHFVGPRLGLVLTGAITAGSVLLSLRNGVPVAILGLVGGFAMPALIGAHSVPTEQLFGYLLAVEVGLVFLVRSRGWSWLLLPTAIAALVWPGYWLLQEYRPGESPWLGLYLAGSIFVLFGALIGTERRSEGRAGLGEAASWIAAVGGLIQMGVLVRASSFSNQDWLVIGSLGAASLVLARFQIRFRALAELAALTCVVLLATWGWLDRPIVSERYLIVSASLGALFSVGAAAASIRSERARGFAWLSWTSLFAHAVVSHHFAAEHFAGPWWAVPAGGGLGAALATWAVCRKGIELARPTAIAWSIGSVALFALAVWFGFDRHGRSIAWVTFVPVLLWIVSRFGLTWLRWAAVVMAGVATGMLLHPEVIGYPLAETWLGSWWLPGYGVPAAVLLGSFGYARRLKLPVVTDWLLGLGVLTSLLGGTMALRFTWHGTGLWQEPWGPIERAVWAMFLGVVSWVLLRMEAAESRMLAWVFAAILVTLSILLVPIVSVFFDSPIGNGETVGEWPIVNELLILYGLPALLFGFLVRPSARAGLVPLARASSISTIWLVFVLVTLEVRQAFQGSDLTWTGELESRESYAYSAAWLVLGMTLLALGLWRRGKTLRFASLVVLLAAIFKTFLFDMSNLRDLWRVASFFGLGAILLLVAWIYQRFVFGKTGGEPD
ncbi:MAG: DUF2339 domain-containing protein [Planctomycetota bacterium]